MQFIQRISIDLLFAGYLTYPYLQVIQKFPFTGNLMYHYIKVIQWIFYLQVIHRFPD